MTDRQCQGTNADGEPCRNPVVGPDGWCTAHRPGGESFMSDIGRKGAKATAAKLRGTGTVKTDAIPVAGPLTSMADAARFAAWIPGAVATGQLDPKRADVAVRAIREFRSAFDTAELEREVKELRGLVAEMKAAAG